ncbi:hypothetical protein DFH07DRAFT_1018137 [Mycena maculata]|uniref:Uncharacterized protein n=1 Tax=Mycena maculata TaxID=230809 RepID=A0AAD7P010_9AGAR|nr:hypothetical protein DFH07DRAFT_1018137 [Mycena maculata]
MDEFGKPPPRAPLRQVLPIYRSGLQRCQMFAVDTGGAAYAPARRLPLAEHAPCAGTSSPTALPGLIVLRWRFMANGATRVYSLKTPLNSFSFLYRLNDGLLLRKSPPPPPILLPPVLQDSIIPAQQNLQNRLFCLRLSLNEAPAVVPDPTLHGRGSWALFASDSGPTPLHTLSSGALVHNRPNRQTSAVDEMPSPTYSCKQCPLNGNCLHRVPKSLRVIHNAEIVAHWEWQVASPAIEHGAVVELEVADSSGMANTFTQLAVDKDEVTPVAVEPQADDADAEIERLASLLTGLVVVDDGAPPHDQIHSKLFSSREDFQSDAPEVLTAFTPMLAAQALQSCQAIAEAHMLPLQPAAMQARENDQVLLREMLQRIRGAQTELDLQRALQASPATVTSLTGALEVATSVVIEAGRLLSSITPPSNRTRKSARRKSRSLDKDQSLEALLLLDAEAQMGRRWEPKRQVSDGSQMGRRKAWIHCALATFIGKRTINKVEQ